VTGDWKSEEGFTTEIAESTEEDQRLNPVFVLVIHVVAEAMTHKQSRAVD
jgi:hypothetical protein